MVSYADNDTALLMILETYTAPPFCYLEFTEGKNFKEQSLGIYIFSSLTLDLPTVTMKTGIRYMTWKPLQLTYDEDCQSLYFQNKYVISVSRRFRHVPVVWINCQSLF